MPAPQPAHHYGYVSANRGPHIPGDDRHTALAKRTAAADRLRRIGNDALREERELARRGFRRKKLGTTAVDRTWKPL